MGLTAETSALLLQKKSLFGIPIKAIPNKLSGVLLHTSRAATVPNLNASNPCPKASCDLRLLESHPSGYRAILYGIPSDQRGYFVKNLISIVATSARVALPSGSSIPLSLPVMMPCWVAHSMAFAA